MSGRRLRALLCLLLAACRNAPSPNAPPQAPSHPSPVPALTAAPASAAPAPAAYRAIHIDTVLPDRHAQFEAARKEWVTELRRVGASDWRGLFLQVGPDRFYSMRALDRFASLDPEPTVPGVPEPPQPSEAAEKRYDSQSDESLAFPHTSEIWRVDEPLGYTPTADGVTEQSAECGTLVIEDVRADTASIRRYRSAVRELVAALEDARYPLTRIAYRTSYGAGHLYTLWLAQTQAVLASAPTVEEVLSRAKGAAKAKEILADIDGVVIRRETAPLKVRRDLTVL